MSERLERWVEHLDLERGLSRNTIQAYRADVERYAGFAHQRGLHPDRRETIRAWLGHERGRGRAASTVSRRLSAVRGFYRFLVAEGRVEADPTEAIDAPRLGRRLPDVLTLEEVERILDAVDTTRRLGLRDRAMIEFLYSTGVRISELVAIQIAECDWRAGVVRLVPVERAVKRRASGRVERVAIGPKGDKVRLVPLGRRAVEAAREYVEGERATLKGSHAGGALFLNFRGRPLTRMGAWKIVRRWVRAARIERAVTPHTFRHTFATHLLDRGADLRAVQEMLGHADITTTQIYTHVDPPYLRAEHRKFHPRA